MEEHFLYDTSSIAAQAKREQLMKEAEEYRLRRHIAAMKKNEVGTKPNLEPDRRHKPHPGGTPHPAPAH